MYTTLMYSYSSSEVPLIAPMEPVPPEAVIATPFDNNFNLEGDSSSSNNGDIVVKPAKEEEETDRSSRRMKQRVSQNSCGNNNKY